MQQATVKLAEAGSELIYREYTLPEQASGSYSCSNYTLNELGKQLLKAASDGNVEELRMLMGKGAPFTADWLGTSPLHLAAQNNHIEVVEILLRAGMSREARTKVERTPLHMAVYEGHTDIVECLLRNGADYECKDLLNMTPLHWAAQREHAAIAETLIRYGAKTNPINKFNLTPIDIAMQMSRPDIVQIINLCIRDPTLAAHQLTMEMVAEDSLGSAILDVEGPDIVDNETKYVPPLPIETVMIEDSESINLDNPVDLDNSEDAHVPEAIEESIETIEGETPPLNSSLAESLKILHENGITMLPVDDGNILSSAMESGHSVVLTDIGKQVLDSIKNTEEQDVGHYFKAKSPVMEVPKKKKIITLTPEEFLAMTTNTGGTVINQNILKQLNYKTVPNVVQKAPQAKRIVMKKNKIVPIAHSSVNIAKVVLKPQSTTDVQVLMDELEKTRKLMENYRTRLLKAELEAAKYKQQLQMLLKQAKIIT